MNQTSYTVNEQEDMVTLCVVLVGHLDRAILLQLLLETSTASSDDFDDTTLTYTFESGAITGDSRCRTIQIAPDGIVESMESFLATLSHSAPAQDVRIREAEAEIVIEDSLLDRKSYCINVNLIANSCLLS